MTVPPSAVLRPCFQQKTQTKDGQQVGLPSQLGSCRLWRPDPVKPTFYFRERFAAKATVRSERGTLPSCISIRKENRKLVSRDRPQGSPSTGQGLSSWGTGTEAEVKRSGASPWHLKDGGTEGSAEAARGWVPRSSQEQRVPDALAGHQVAF